ncbi:MAG TPA: type IIL restriction-modification enzyme MmeI [Acidobacteriaceae bacterium]
MSVIDFGVNMSKNDASLFELPFEYVKKKVLPKREKFWKDGVEDRWWLHQRTRPAFRDALAAKARYLATPRHSKFRFFVWLDSATVPDSALAVVARDDEYMLGILSSRAHEIWARAQGTQVRDVESGFRYTPESCFDTFPFPWPPGKEDQSGPLVQAIATAASELVRQRDEWLNPPGADEDELKQRTLTKLYNRRAAGEMTWLDNAHRTLDAAVFAAYGWPADLSRDEILSRLLDLNRARAAVV